MVHFRRNFSEPNQCRLDPRYVSIHTFISKKYVEITIKSEKYVEVLYVMLLTAKSENLNIVVDAIYYTLSISNFLLPSERPSEICRDDAPVQRQH
jgi:hypothetical protein